jgi:hypothetical protein
LKISKDAYTNEKENIEKLLYIYIYNFNISNEYANEWTNYNHEYNNIARYMK